MSSLPGSIFEKAEPEKLLNYSSRRANAPCAKRVLSVRDDWFGSCAESIAGCHRTDRAAPARLGAVAARLECPDVESSPLRACDTSLVGRQRRRRVGVVGRGTGREDCHRWRIARAVELQWQQLRIALNHRSRTR